MDKDLLPFFALAIMLSALAGDAFRYVTSGDLASHFRLVVNTAERVPGLIEDTIDELRL